MLTELRIANFAVIDRLSLEFSRGFHVLTGETGAGKSILIDAIALLVGGRASVDQIRAEAEEAELEAAFSLPQHGPVIDRLRDLGDLELPDGELIIRRVLSRSGRNRLYLNGRLVPLHAVQDLAGTLVDIHGQHDQQSLLSVESQRDALDGFGNLKDTVSDYRRRYQDWRAGQRLLEELNREAVEGKRHEELLRFQCREIEEAGLQPEEEETLLAERNRLAHAHKLEALGEEAYQVLYGSQTSVLGGLGLIGDRLRELASMDPGAARWGGPCDAAAIELQELAHELRDYLQRLEHDPARLVSVEERLDRIQRLKRKYGGSVDALLSQVEDLNTQLERITGSQSRISELEDRVAQDFKALQSVAVKLSEGRMRVAREFGVRVVKELRALRMGDTRFQIGVRPDTDDTALTVHGRDRVEYLLSANPGEPLLPLSKVASGGELSRVMLALKTVLAESDRVPVLIFDEVDAGIGGATAEVMGRRLRALGAYHQVFCITHLPQIASQADRHLLVEKTVQQNRTVTHVKLLDQGGRREEIARMLGGVRITGSVRQTAAEMIGGTDRG